jgi:hypothetical protein
MKRGCTKRGCGTTMFYFDLFKLVIMFKKDLLLSIMFRMSDR